MNTQGDTSSFIDRLEVVSVALSSPREGVIGMV